MSLAWCAILLALSIFSAHAGQRVALVIGNAAYHNAPALANPVNDAEDFAAALRRVGFTVVLERNLDRRGLETAIAHFARVAQDAEAVLFYYAGHGMQYRGLNYLVPTDAKLDDEFNLNFELTRLDEILFVLERARGVKVLVLDACRNNPLMEKLSRKTASRSVLVTRGLARIEPTRGMITAYSTQSNQVSVDGTGRNSPFTAALVQEIKKPGLEIGALFRRVAAEVNRATQGRQLPEISVSLVGEFYLNSQETDVQAWGKVRDSGSSSAIREFILRYPDSILAPDARQRLAALERDRLAPERTGREQAERERIARERVETERKEHERIAREQDERARREQEERSRARVERENRESERRAEEQAQADRERTEKQTARKKSSRVQIANTAPHQRLSNGTPACAGGSCGNRRSEPKTSPRGWCEANCKALCTKIYGRAAAAQCFARVPCSKFAGRQCTSAAVVNDRYITYCRNNPGRGTCATAKKPQQDRARRSNIRTCSQARSVCLAECTESRQRRGLANVQPYCTELCRRRVAQCLAIGCWTTRRGQRCGFAKR